MEKNANIVIGVLAVISVGLGIASVRLLQQVDVEHETALAEATKREQAETTIKEMQARYDALQNTYLQMRERPTPVDAPVKAATTIPPIQSVQPERRARNLSAGFGNQQAIYMPPNDGRGRPIGPRQIGNVAMVKSLKLNESDEAKLLKIMTEDQDKFRQALAASDGKPLDQQVVDTLRAEADQHVRDVVGDAKYDEYQDYRKYMAEHEQINRLNMRLANTEGGALSDEQENRLFMALKEEKNRIPAPAPTQFATRPEFSAAYDQWRQAYVARTQTRAATILTPEQLRAFRVPPNFPFRGPQPNN